MSAADIADGVSKAAPAQNDAPPADTRTPQDYSKLVETLLPTVNGAAQRVQALWFTFVSFGAYLTIAVLGTTHRMLFLEEPVKMPLLNIDLPLTSFYTLAPGLLIVFHVYFLIQLVLLARTASEFEQALSRSQLTPAERDTLRMRIDNSIFVQLLIGAEPERRGGNHWFLAPMAWLTVIVMPIALLLLIQLQFLPYHAAALTWLHRVALTLDLLIVLALWPIYAFGRGLPSLSLYFGSARPARDKVMRCSFVAVPAVLLLAVSWCVATFSTEAMHGNVITRFPGILADAMGATSPPSRLILAARDRRFVGNRPVSWFSFTEMMFEPNTNYVSGAPGGLFANNIILPDRVFVDDKMVRDLDQAEAGVTPGKHRVIRSFRGRDLAGAVLPRTDLRRSDFTGADLRGANFVGASLQRSHFGCATDGNGDAVMQSPKEIDRSTCARLNGAMLRVARLDEVFLNGAVLEDADLRGARLVGATFWNFGRTGAQNTALYVHAIAVKANFAAAQLQGAALERIRLDGANFDQTDLRGASLMRASLVGASFFGSDLVGTDFTNADLRAATMTQATPVAASFEGANMRGVMIENSDLHGAKMRDADLAGGVMISGPAWRINGAPKPSPGSSVGLETERPPFGNKTFAEWRKEQLDRVTDPKARAAVDEALAVLDPDRKLDDEDAFPKWLLARAQLPVDLKLQSDLTREFIALACDGGRGPYIAYNLIHSSAPRAMGPRFKAFAEKIARANDEASKDGAATCPGAVGIYNDALQRMAEILKDGTNPQ